MCNVQGSHEAGIVDCNSRGGLLLIMSGGRKKWMNTSPGE